MNSSNLNIKISLLNFNLLLIKLFYQIKARINQTSETSFKNFLENELGGWPLLNKKDNDLSIIDLLTRLYRYYITDDQDNSIYQFLFSIYIDRDQNDSKKKKIQVRLK
jgi:hypothetical protein